MAFLDHPLFGDDRGSVAIVDRSGGKKTLSTAWESMQGVAWSPSGEEIWFTATRAGSSRALYAVTPSGRQRQRRGHSLRDDAAGHLPRRTRARRREQKRGSASWASFPARRRSATSRGWSGPSGRSWPADAKSVVFTEQGEAGGPGYSVYLRRVDGSAPVRLGEGSALAISPDGKWVLAALVRSTPSRSCSPDRSRRAEAVPEGRDRARERVLRGVPSGRQADRLRRQRAGAAAARLPSGPRGRGGEARYRGGFRQAPSSRRTGRLS